MELSELTPEQRSGLEGAVNKLVVKLDLPDLPESWHIWWRQDYERFVAQYPDANRRSIGFSGSPLASLAVLHQGWRGHHGSPSSGGFQR
jgi:hypothetical protein